MNSNELHGRNYIKASRYNYYAIDYSEDNSTSICTTESGLNKKAADILLNNLEEEQNDSLTKLGIAQLTGNSFNSENLYLYTTNTRELYKEYYSRIKQHALEVFQPCYTHQLEDLEIPYSYNLISLYRLVQEYFEAGVSCYETEINQHADISERSSFTALDINICTIRYIKYLVNEYLINKLA